MKTKEKTVLCQLIEKLKTKRDMFDAKKQKNLSIIGTYNIAINLAEQLVMVEKEQIVQSYISGGSNEHLYDFETGQTPDEFYEENFTIKN